MSEGLRVEVRSVKQSPLNERRWCLELACGHDLSVTSDRKPQRKSATCPHPSHEPHIRR